MGPIALFDKSFLQSLSLDESVWFDNFFLANVCPLFYVETLADLRKVPGEGRSPEDEVRIIAEKFPEVSAAPCAHHMTLCLSELFGRPVPLDGRIPLPYGRAVTANGMKAVLYEESPEADAFRRWQDGEFSALEHLHAASWRRSLSTLSLQEVAGRMRASFAAFGSCRTLADALDLATRMCSMADTPHKAMQQIMDAVRMPHECRSWVHDCWRKAGALQAHDYAPYAVHVMTVDLFFAIALGASLISGERASNRVDIAYLYYLPFCQVFVSSDRLHRRCSSLFLRPDQEFVWGPDLKADLTRLNERYSKLPASTREGGVMSFASSPPEEEECLVSSLWDRYLPGWRSRERRAKGKGSPTAGELCDKLRRLEQAPSAVPGQVGFDPEDLDMVARKRKVRRRKGSWYQVPKDLE